MLRTTLVALIATLAATAARPSTCTTSPVQWTVNNIYIDGVTPSQVTNDGSAAYINGQSGVTATISTCGNEDAVIALTGSQRSVSFQFTAPLYTDQYTPAGLNGSALHVDSVDVRNILYQHDAASEYTFTTRLGANFVNLGPFRMVNLGSQAIPPGEGGDNVANTPYADALVFVHHCPKSTVPAGACPALGHETYFVYPDPATFGTSSQTGLTVAQTGTLLLTEGKGKSATTVNAGEFSMPFYFAISLLN
jgi:hypothetical protein